MKKDEMFSLNTQIIEFNDEMGLEERLELLSMQDLQNMRGGGDCTLMGSGKCALQGMTICPTESCDPYFVGCGIDGHQGCNSDSFCLGDDFDHCMAMT